MEKLLFLTDVQQDGNLSRVSLESFQAALELARKIGGSALTVGLIGAKSSPAAEALAGSGAEVWAVTGPDFAPGRYASDAFALEHLCRRAGATLVVAPSNPRFQRALPGVAQRLGGAIDTHLTGLDYADGKLNVQRWYYRQRMLATLSRPARPWCLLVESGIYPAFAAGSGSVKTEELNLALPDALKRTTVAGVKAPASGTNTIRPDAKLLFVAGAGWTKKQSDGQPHVKEAEALILSFLGRAQASLGSSKSLVDQSGEGHAVMSFMSHLNQVGQTGATPRHPKGLATCCHGEEPHVVGWRFINERRAVNLDANCGWAQGKADVLYVADAFKVMEKVNELLSNLSLTPA